MSSRSSGQTCRSCGARFPLAAKFCGQCGKPLSGAPRLGQSWGATFLVVALLMGAAMCAFFGLAFLIFDAPTPNSITAGIGFLLIASGCVWGLVAIARH